MVIAAPYKKLKVIKLNLRGILVVMFVLKIWWIWLKTLLNFNLTKFHPLSLSHSEVTVHVALGHIL